MIKKYGVWIALALTLAATAWVSQSEEKESQSNVANDVAPTFNRTTRTSHPSPVVQAKAESQIDSSALLMQRPIITEEPRNIFTPYIAVENMSDKNASESVVQAVVNPFVYAGKLVEDGKVIVFLIDGDKNHAVKSGDVIEEMWQVKSITPPVMTLKNIPSKIEIQLQIGALS
ncbi:MAG: hypothetical protein PSV17_05815 [Methylotenera sp.]|uniref:hypothetical protein n=1 Tax=Methylotenera sp. TaxID=2051956 RepID=UPI002488B3DC|nr:hypothetical protein [Methylotenera sp.]MDI1308934.1 hypothetical protein [Methylotenera sp.]